MSDAPLGRFWAEGPYRGADLLHEWLTNVGYEACHAEQRDWMACEWYERPQGDSSLPPRLVLAWDARSEDDLEWVQLAVPDVRPLVKPFEGLGIEEHGSTLVPAPPAPPQANACRLHEPTASGPWAALSLDLPTLSPLIFQAAVQRLAKTWQTLRPVMTEDQVWPAVHAFDDFPDLPGWVYEIATANADRRVDVFRGTGGAYWTFNSHGTAGPKIGHVTGRVPDADAFVAWVESTDLPDHAAYERPAQGAGVLMGTFGWTSFFLRSATLEVPGSQRDTAMHEAMALLHLAGKGAPHHHRDGELWRRPLTVVADRDAGLSQVRHRGPQDGSYVADEAASAWLNDVLLGRPDADSHLLRRIEVLVEPWRVHS